MDDPAQYTLELLPDGQVRIQADCNSGGGTYTLDGSQLAIEITTTTTAMCPPGSLSNELIRNLNAAVSYVMEGGDLYISLRYDSGILKFVSRP